MTSRSSSSASAGPHGRAGCLWARRTPRPRRLSGSCRHEVSSGRRRPCCRRCPEAPSDHHDPRIRHHTSRKWTSVAQVVARRAPAPVRSRLSSRAGAHCFTHYTPTVPSRPPLDPRAAHLPAPGSRHAPSRSRSSRSQPGPRSALPASALHRSPRQPPHDLEASLGVGCRRPLAPAARLATQVQAWERLLSRAGVDIPRADQWAPPCPGRRPTAVEPARRGPRGQRPEPAAPGTSCGDAPVPSRPQPPVIDLRRLGFGF